MSENQDNQDRPVREIDVLKQRADLLGIKYSPNIGVDTLRERISEVTEGQKEQENRKETGRQLNERELRNRKHRKIRDEALKLIRIRLTNMNPHTSDIPGDFFTVSNKIIGDVRKYIPYDPAYYVNGYHVPQCILDQLQNKKFLTTRIVRDPSAPGGERTETLIIKEFAIEILPQLTPAQMRELAADQRSRNAVS